MNHAAMNLPVKPLCEHMFSLQGFKGYIADYYIGGYILG